MIRGILTLSIILTLTACGTVRGTTSGLLEGASQDLSSLSKTIKGN